MINATVEWKWSSAQTPLATHREVCVCVCCKGQCELWLCALWERDERVEEQKQKKVLII